jgi:hypothetical protein
MRGRKGLMAAGFSNEAVARAAELNLGWGRS